MAIINDQTQSYLIFLFFLWLFSTFLLQYLFKKPNNNSTLHHLPTPPALPLVGHLYLLSRVGYKCFHNLSSKYGPLFYLRLGSFPLIVISSESLASEIFKTNDLLFTSKPKTPFNEGLLFQNYGFFLAPYGDYWVFMKKLCVTELLGARQIQRSRFVRNEELKRFLKIILEKAYKKKKVDLSQELVKLSNNSICRMVMSTRCSKEDDEAQKCKELVAGSMELAVKSALASFLGPLKKLGLLVFKKQLEDVPREYDELLEKIMKEHEDRAKRDNGGEREDKDLMDILLQVYQDKNAEFKMSRNHIKAFVLDLFIAGTHTPVNTVEWVMGELINHPNVFKKLREEIESVVGTNRLVEESDIPNLHYLQAIVKEALRLYPLGPAIPRECGEDCKIGGFNIPKGTTVLINLYSIMRDPEIWENPNEFYPERFLQDNQKEINKNQNSFGFVPFGGGRRMCPGSHLALTSINITVAYLVQCFDWKVDGNGGKINMEAQSGMVLCMGNPLLCLPIVHFNPYSDAA